MAGIAEKPATPASIPQPYDTSNGQYVSPNEPPEQGDKPFSDFLKELAQYEKKMQEQAKKPEPKTEPVSEPKQEKPAAEDPFELHEEPKPEPKPSDPVVQEPQEEQEVELTPEQSEVYNLFSAQYGLDKKKLSEASPEDLQRIREAIETMQKRSKTQSEISHINSQYQVYNVWKNVVTMLPEDLGEKLESGSFDKKVAYFQDIIKKAEESSDAFSAVEAKKKLDALEKLKEAYHKVTALKSQLDELPSMEQCQAVVESFCDAENPFSPQRKAHAYEMEIIEDQDMLIGNWIKKTEANTTPEEAEALGVWISGSYHAISEPLLGLNYSGGYEKKNALSSIPLITQSISKCSVPHDMYAWRYTGDIFGVSGIEDMVEGKNGTGKMFSSLQSYISKGNDLQALVGATFVNKTFMAARPTKLAGGYNAHGSAAIIMKVYLPKGSKAQSLRKWNKGENELLIQRGGTFRIAKIEKKGGMVQMEVELVQEASQGQLNEDYEKAKEILKK